MKNSVYLYALVSNRFIEVAIVKTIFFFHKRYIDD